MKVPVSEQLPPEIMENYAGKWIAIARGKVIAQGGTPKQALSAAQQVRYKEKFNIVFIPRLNMLQLPPIVDRLRLLLPKSTEIYLVGGVVRDALRGMQSKDIDIIVSGEAIPVARSVANTLRVPFYPLKEEMDVARIVSEGNDGQRFYLDFSSLRGKSLDEDLIARDFTINAIAINLHDPEKVYDPTGGVKDLLAGEIRACSEASIHSDPIRILRAVRLAAKFRFKIMPDTRKLIRQSAAMLTSTSPERQRDELVRILVGPQPDAAIIALDMLGVLTYIFPEVPDLKGITQSPPHTRNVFVHTITVIQKLAAVIEVLGPNHDPEGLANNLTYGQLSLRLGRFREPLTAHLSGLFTPERSTRASLFLAALYHDAGKKDTKSIAEDGQIHFYTHEIVGSLLIDGRAHYLRLSNDEIQRVVTIVRHHMRPLMLTNTGELPSRKAVYRFFRDTGAAGVDICLLSLADFLGTYGENIPQDKWAAHLETIRLLLEAWWEKPDKEINPTLLLDGNEIIRIFGLQPGPIIGQVLNYLHEMQAVGMVNTHEEAIHVVGQYLQKTQKRPGD